LTGKNDMNGTEGYVVHTVSQITDKIKAKLEDSFPFIWITGEISNFRCPQSGHFYFVLKDESAQISAVMFRGQNRNLSFDPEDGMSVTGLGRISLYKPRGTYQVIFEYLEPKGIGALQVAFEQLKARLSAEGFFEPDRKKPIPFLPSKIALITSPTGAVIHDILRVARRRFDNMRFMLVPVKVQGQGAVEDIVEAIELVNRHGADVAIIARGGGSIEDLQAFNSEAVARAISSSICPIVSAVGHETDYTITDFTSDLRAPTPSAAAEIVVPKKEDLTAHLLKTTKDIKLLMMAKISDAEKELAVYQKHLVDPVKRIDDLKLKNDDMVQRMTVLFNQLLKIKKDRFSWISEILANLSPAKQIKMHRRNLDYTHDLLRRSMVRSLDVHQNRLKTVHEKLNTLSPLSVLERGYSIVRTRDGNKIVRSEAQVERNQKLEVILAKGTLDVTVDEKHDEGNI